MTYALFLLISMIILIACAKAGVTEVPDVIWVVIAILTSAEGISWRCGK